MAAKAAVRATKPRAAKKAARRATRKAARKARRAAKPKAPKAAARKATKPRAPKRAARKAKRVTKKSQTGSFRRVWSGTAVYTKGGLTKKDLCMNKNGRVVSKKKHANMKKRNPLKGWTNACKKARKELGITGFVLMNKGAQGKALYKAAKALYK